MTNSDTVMEVERDYFHNRITITFSISHSRWMAASKNCNFNIGEVLGQLASQDRLAELFMQLSILFMDKEEKEIRQVRVEVIDPLPLPHSHESSD